MKDIDLLDLLIIALIASLMGSVISDLLTDKQQAEQDYKIEQLIQNDSIMAANMDRLLRITEDILTEDSIK